MILNLTSSLCSPAKQTADGTVVIRANQDAGGTKLLELTELLKLTKQT